MIARRARLAIGLAACFATIALGSVSWAEHVAAPTPPKTTDKKAKEKAATLEAIEYLRNELRQALNRREAASKTVEVFKAANTKPSTSETAPKPPQPTPTTPEGAAAPTEPTAPTTTPASPPTTPATPTPERPAVADAQRAAEVLDRAKREVPAYETAILVLRGAKVDAKQIEEALAVLNPMLDEARIRQRASKDLGVTGAEAESVSFLVRVLEFSKGKLDEALAQQKGPILSQESPKELKELEFALGDKLQYGPTVSLLRFNVSRPPDEPGRLRNYEPRLDFIPAEFGFQFVYQPHNRPWRLKRADGLDYQLMAVGGMLLARLDTDRPERGSLSLAATLSFFEQLIGLGVGVDLYRGISTQGANGAAGTDTAYTGLLSWAFVRDGEVTPENVFVVFTLGLEPLIQGLTGEIKP